MNDKSAPPPQPTAVQAAALDSRYSLLRLGDRLELRDRLFPDHVLGRFPPTAEGQAAATAELRRLGGEMVGPSVRRPRRSGRRPWTLAVGLALAVLLAVTFVPRLLEGGSRPLSNAEVLARTERGMMLVTAFLGESPLAFGSGWIYDLEQGLVVTNAHVVEGGSSFQVGRRGEGFVRASLLGAAPCHDLALLQLSLPPGYEALELAPDDPSRTERVAAMGYPLGVDGAPDQGQPRSAFGEVVDPEVYVTNDPAGALIRHSAWLGNGDSGGPLVDMRGRVVGVNRSVLVGIRSASLAIPVSTVREVVPDLAAGRNVC